MNFDEKEPKEKELTNDEQSSSNLEKKQEPTDNHDLSLLQHQHNELQKEIEELKRMQRLENRQTPSINKPFMNKKQTLFTIGVCLATAFLTGGFFKAHDVLEKEAYQHQVEYHLFHSDDSFFYYHVEENEDQ